MSHCRSKWFILSPVVKSHAAVSGVEESLLMQVGSLLTGLIGALRGLPNAASKCQVVTSVPELKRNYNGTGEWV